MNPYEKPDYYSNKAKEEGYAARSVYKLIEINKKFNLIKKNQIILDLGCAPGSWSQFVSKIVESDGKVIGIDYKKITVELSNAFFIQGDFFDEENKKKIKEYALFDGIISDMAPDTVGDRLADCYNSSELVKNALNFTYKYLKKDGFFVAKIFQGGDEKLIISEMRKAFKEVKYFKPMACRKISFEIYIIGKYFIKKPDNIESDEKIKEISNNGEMPW